MAIYRYSYIPMYNGDIDINAVCFASLLASLALHSLLLVISAALRRQGTVLHAFQKQPSVQMKSQKELQNPRVPRPLSLPGNTCRQCILNELAPSFGRALPSVWNNLQTLFFLFAIPLEVNSSAFSCFSLLRVLIKEGHPRCWNSRTNI